MGAAGYELFSTSVLFLFLLFSFLFPFSNSSFLT
jgi:hypothetical protein